MPMMPPPKVSIFFEGNTPVVDVNEGDLVQVTGTVTEFNGETQLGNISSIQVVSPAGDANTPVATPVQVTLPETTNGELEQYEGMLVDITSTMTVSQNFFLGRYGQITLASPDDQGNVGRLFQPTNEFLPLSTDAIDLANENARRLLVLDDGQDDDSFGDNPNPVPYLGAPDANGDPTNIIRGGDTVTDLVGVIDFGQIDTPSGGITRDYRLHPTQAPTFTPVNTRTTAPDSVGGSLKVASFNVLNFFNGDGQGGGFPTARGADTASELTRQTDKLVAAIDALDADIVGLIEIENDGYGPNSAIQELVDSLNAVAGANTYAFVDPGTGSQLGTDAITVGFIYKTATVNTVGTSAVLDETIDPRFDTTVQRPALAQTFEEISSGETLTVVNNHFKSKGSIVNDEADIGDGQGNNNPTRTRAAEALVDWLATDPTASGDSDVLIVGDLNAYAKEDPITAILEGADDTPGNSDDFTDVIDQFVTEGYSFTFDGQAGYLDHALASTTLISQVTGATEWHINTDEAAVLDYNEEFNGGPYYNADPYRSSDHDPVLVGLNLSSTTGNTAPDIVSAATATVDENQTSAIDVEANDDTDTEGSGLTYSISDGADQTLFSIDSATGVVTFDAAPDFEAPGDANGDNNYEVQVTVTDSGGLTDVQDIIITVTDAAENTAPFITSDETASVPENQTTAIDVDAGDDFDAEGAGLTYSLTGGADAALFSIDAATGVVTFNNAPDFENPGDVGGDNTYDFEVTVTDSGLLTDVQNVAVTVTNVNEPPTTTLRVEAEDINNVMGYRLEGNNAASGGQMLSLVGFGGPEVGMATFLFSGATGSYDIDLGTFDESDGTANFVIEQDGTQIGSTIVLDQNTNGGAGANNSTRVTRLVGTGIQLTNGSTIKVTGNEQASEHARFDFIEFTPSNGGSDTPPTATDDTATTSEASSVDINVLGNDTGTPPLEVIEVDGNTVTAGTPITLPSGALLTLNNDGSFTYDPNGVFDALNTGQTDTDSFDYLVNNTLGVSEGTVTVTINGIDDSTLGLTINPSSISENGGVANATVSRDTTVGDLVVTLSSSDPGEADVQASVTIANGDTTAPFTITGQDDNAVDGSQTVTITAAAAGFNEGTADITVTDDDAVLPTVLVEAEDISNANRTGYRIENKSVASGGSMLSLLGQGGGEVGTASFTFNETSGNYTLILGTFDEGDGQANFTVDQNGTQVGAIVLDQDPGGNGASANTKVERTVATNVFVATGDTFTITGFEDQSEHARFDFFRFDPAGPTPEVAPEITTADQATVPENQTVVLNVNATDANGDSEGNGGLTYGLTGGADQNSFAINANTGLLSFIAPPDFENPGDSNNNNVYAVEVTVTDSTNRTDSQLINVTVTDVNETGGGGPVIRLEGEDADTIVNYRTENIGVASEGQVLSFRGGGSGEEGSATFNFGDSPDELLGNYDIVVATFDESDGEANFTIDVNGNQVGDLLLDGSLGSNLANASTFISPTVALGVSLAPGDTITVNGFENGGEHARLDYIELVPSTGPF